MTTYVVYHVDSTQVIKEFNSESSAKRSCTCMNRNAENRGEFPEQELFVYRYTTRKNYEQNVVKKVKVRNLMTGEEVEIDSNTPWCCNPASETYWSM